LVQRSTLDFFTVAFPLHNSQLIHSDMAKIVIAAINVLLRRDMSLNRRLYAWLLGTSTASAASQDIRGKGSNPELNESVSELSYFEKYSQELLVHALRQKLIEKPDISDGSSLKSAVLKPFRILISLLDKPEIGPVILESVLLAIFRCLYREFQQSKCAKESKRQKSQPKEDLSSYEELLKTANLLFGTFEPYFIWDYAARMFEQACVRSNSKMHRQLSRQVSGRDQTEAVSIVELCDLLTFLLDIVSLVRFL